MKQQRRNKARPWVEPLETRLVPATINVSTHLDEDNGVLGGGAGISLREAIRYSADGDTIIVPANTYTLTRAGRNENFGSTGDLDIHNRVTILGAGANVTIINAASNDRVFDIHTPFSISGGVRLEGLTIRGGLALVEPMEDEAKGGGIRHNNGALELHRVIVRDNVAEGDDVFAFSGEGVPAEGGGIWSQAPLLLNTSRVVNNRAEGGSFFPSGGLGSGGSGGHAEGGGIYNAAPLELVNSTVDGNTAQGGNAGVDTFGSGSGGDAAGGGIGTGAVAASLILEGSTISNNQARGGDGTVVNSSAADGGDAEGGGLYTDAGPNSFTNSTISGNSADAGDGDSYGGGGSAEGGGAYLAFGDTFIGNTTITNNEAEGGDEGGSTFGDVGGGDGGGVYLGTDGFVDFENTILAANRAADGDGNSSTSVDYGTGNGGGGDPITSLGFNFVGVDQDGVFDKTGDKAGTFAMPLDPELGPLADNGGPTQTHTPLFGSPVINMGGGSGAGDPDQRGVSRPVGMQADIGAVEYSDAPKLLQFNVLYGAMKFDLLDPFNPIRVNLPWRVTGVEAVFTEAVTGTAASLTGVPAIATFTGSGTATLRWTFAGAGVQTAILNAALVGVPGVNAITDTDMDTSDNQLDGNCNGVGKDNFTRTVRVLFGDFNDDSVVSAADFVAINQRRTATNPYNPFADLDGDGDVDTADVNLARSRVGQSLPPPSPD